MRRYVVHCLNIFRKGRGVVFCVEIEPASLQGLKGEPSDKIVSRNRHQLVTAVYVAIMGGSFSSPIENVINYLINQTRQTTGGDCVIHIYLSTMSILLEKLIIVW